MIHQRYTLEMWADTDFEYDEMCWKLKETMHQKGFTLKEQDDENYRVVFEKLVEKEAPWLRK